MINQIFIYFLVINGDFMKKAFLSMALFLLVCFSVNAQNYTIKKQVVGTGGFIAKEVGSQKIYGIFGQPVTGIMNPTVEGKTGTMYMGFWAFEEKPTSVEDVVVGAKGVTNFPNPVSNLTTFKFNLKEDSYVTLNVYNGIGMLIATVTQNNFMSAGENTVDWDISKSQNSELLNSGSYMYEVLIVPVQASAASNAYSYRNILMIAR